MTCRASTFQVPALVMERIFTGMHGRKKFNIPKIKRSLCYTLIVNSIYIPVVAFQQFVNLQKGVQQIVGALTKKEQLVLTLLLFAELLSVSRGVESIKRLGGGRFRGTLLE